MRKGRRTGTAVNGSPVKQLAKKFFVIFQLAVIMCVMARTKESSPVAPATLNENGALAASQSAGRVAGAPFLKE